MRQVLLIVLALGVLGLSIWLVSQRGPTAVVSLEPQLEWVVAPRPVLSEPIEVSFRLKDKSGALINGAKVVLEANMTHPGMAPVYSQVQEISEGTYSSLLQLTMAGDWVLLFDIELVGQNQRVQRSVSLPGVQ